MEVHHIGYLVKKLDKAVAAFDGLGFTGGDIVRDEGRGVDICFMKNCGGYCIELVSPYCKESVVSGLIKRYKNAPYHICYVCKDIEKTAGAMCGAGYVQMDEIKEAPAIGGRRVCFLLHADIGMVELVEQEK